MATDIGTQSVEAPTAHLDDAHVGDIMGALGTLRRHTPHPVSWGRRLLALAAIMGPGPLVMVGDNDAGGVATYSQAGQNYGTSLTWSVRDTQVGNDDDDGDGSVPQTSRPALLRHWSRLPR